MRAFLGLGSNLGIREKLLQDAIDLLSKTDDISILQCSSIVESEPWGVRDQSFFLNQVVEIETALLPQDLLSRVKQIEKNSGREEESYWGPRYIDVDILLYGDLNYQEQNLQIPHKHLKDRRFVLISLAQMIPNMIVPGFDCSIKNLLERCTDQSKVELWNPDESGE